MKDLIQYLQTLPIGPLIWVEVVVSAVASVLVIVFVSVIFYRLLFPRKKRL